MAKKHSISLSIPTPCHEDWDKMTANEKDRHCASCNKTVIDFSLYTDKELVDFFKKTQGHVCGRLNNYHVSQPIIVTEQHNRTFFHKLFLGSALASWLGFGISAKAQDKIAPQTITQEQNDSLKKKTVINDTCAIVSGTIHDKTEQPLPFANVIITYLDTVIENSFTDIDGKYRIPVLKKYLNKKLLIKFIALGYKDVSYEFTLTKNKTLKIIDMKAEPVFMMGLVEIKMVKDNRPFNTTYKSTYTHDDILHMPH